MSAAEQSRTAVLAGFDGSAGSERAVRWAAREAVIRGHDLVIVQSYEWSVTMVPDAAERFRTIVAEKLDAIADECRGEHPDLRVDTRMPDGPPEHTIPPMVAEEGADLLVLGATGLGAIARALLGSTVAELAHNVHIPIVVVRGEQPDPAGPVVAGLDGSDAGDAAVRFALEFADRHNTSVRVVHALSAMPAISPALSLADTTAIEPLLEPEQHAETTEDVIGLRVKRLRESFPRVAVDCEIVSDRPGAALMERADGAGLLVVGSHGHGLVDRILIGSVSHAVLYHAPCTVALVRPD